MKNSVWLSSVWHRPLIMNSDRQAEKTSGLKEKKKTKQNNQPTS